MEAANRSLLRTLIKTAPSLSSLLLNSSSYSSSAAAAAAALPKKKWQIFNADPPPATAASKSQRPKTVQWSEDICNSASFVGTVTQPVQKIDTSSGGFRACTSLLVKAPSNPNHSFRILLKMWDKMAEISLEHIKQNDFLHVSGCLESYTKTDANNVSETFYEVNVKEINYVAECEHSSTNKKAEQIDSGGDSGAEKTKKYRAQLQLWQLFFTDPSKWNDNRNKKAKPNHPDFKHKETGEVLWISAHDPQWVKIQLKMLDSKLTNQEIIEEGSSSSSLLNSAAGDSGVEKTKMYRTPSQLWQLFFKDPSKWYDNRNTKKKPNHPDFKHKDTGEALWINNCDLPWVKTQLQMLDSKLTNQETTKEDSSNSSLLNSAGDSVRDKITARLQLWQVFFTNPSEWHDNRNIKKKPNHPDFKHKDSGEALWISPRDPPWVKTQLQMLDSKLTNQDDENEGSSSSSLSSFL